MPVLTLRQGQEAKVTILTTVVTDPNYAENLGFASNDKKFNVAITRAMVVFHYVSVPHILTHWNTLVAAHCSRKFRGHKEGLKVGEVLPVLP